MPSKCLSACSATLMARCHDPCTGRTLFSHETGRAIKSDRIFRFGRSLHYTWLPKKDFR